MENLFNPGAFKQLNDLLDSSTPLFNVIRHGEEVFMAHVLITGSEFQSTNTDIIDGDTLVDPSGREYIVMNSSASPAGQVLGNVKSPTEFEFDKHSISVNGNAVIGNNNVAFNTVISSSVQAIKDEVNSSDLTDAQKQELESMIDKLDENPANAKGYLSKFADFFEDHPNATRSLGVLLSRWILGM